jgi:predicted transcriptional regulator
MEDRGMTECELLVMKVIWSSDRNLSMKEVTELVNSTYGKSWKTQTVSTFLARLVRKEFLTMERKGRVFYYQPTILEADYGKKEIEKCVNFWGAGKINSILAAFSEVRKFTKDEKEQIQSLLNDMD